MLLPNIGVDVKTVVATVVLGDVDVPNCTVGKVDDVPNVVFAILLVGKVTVEVELPVNEVAVVVTDGFALNENSGLFDVSGAAVPKVNNEGVVDTPNPLVLLAVVFATVEFCVGI